MSGYPGGVSPTKRPDQRVAVVIPAKDEAERIATTVRACRSIPRVDLVIVVDDGGGAIFSRLEYAHTTAPSRFERLFTTPQCANISGLAAALGARVHVPEDVAALQELLAEPVVGLSVVVWRAEEQAGSGGDGSRSDARRTPNARTT